MKRILLTLCFSLAFFGCARARVDVGGTEKPIKVDVTMRVDVYQHVVQQADDIENMIRGTSEPKVEESKPQSSLSLFFVKDAWAGEISASVEEAIQNRKARLELINKLLTTGAIGENNQGEVQIRDISKLSVQDQSAVSDENDDRRKIYRDLAQQNGASMEEIRSIYTEKMQQLAPTGSPIQDASGNWSVK